MSRMKYIYIFTVAGISTAKGPQVIYDLNFVGFLVYFSNVKTAQQNWKITEAKKIQKTLFQEC
jgi:hypothetical protein